MATSRAARPGRADVSGRFRTNSIHQAYIEPQSCLAWTDTDGTLVVSSSTQGAFMVRQGLCDMLRHSTRAEDL